MNYLVDVYSMVNKAPVTVLRSAEDGKVVMPLETADISRLEAEGWKAPEVFTAKGGDGKTDMWGRIVRPTNFDPNRKYPVIEYIYQGPGDQYVPKTFIPYNWYMTSLAELGFIVVMADGMGTSFRSREFENVRHKNLKDAGLPDHIAWIKAAGEKGPVYGYGSAQASTAVPPVAKNPPLPCCYIPNSTKPLIPPVAATTTAWIKILVERTLAGISRRRSI